MRRGVAVALACVLGAACGPGGPEDGGARDGACSLEVGAGTGGLGGYVPIGDGDAVEVILGFQGFRMLDLTVPVGGAPGDDVDVSLFLSVEDTGVEVNQQNRGMPLRPMAGGGLAVERFLVFFNDVAAPDFIGHRASVELIARSGGCTGTHRAALVLRDDETCVDTTIVVDAAVPEGGLDGGAVCDGGVP